MNTTQIANMAHKTAELLVSRMGVPTDLDGVSRVACGCDGIDPDSSEGEIYQDRMIGHFVNIQCGTAGR